MREPILEVPNCDDPVFVAWCKLCGLRPGQVVDARDARLAELQDYMQGYGYADYDPEADPDDDYLMRGL